MAGGSPIGRTIDNRDGGRYFRMTDAADFKVAAARGGFFAGVRPAVMMDGRPVETGGTSGEVGSMLRCSLFGTYRERPASMDMDVACGPWEMESVWK